LAQKPLRSPAVVLGLCPNGLGAIRSLGRNGIPVIGVDYKLGGPGFYSKYAKTELCPNPYLYPEQMCQFLMNIGNKLDEKGVLFPTSDEFVLFISRYRHELQNRFSFALPSDELVEALLNKRWQYVKAEETKTPYPQTFYPESMDDLYDIKDKIEYPSIIKPCYTHFWKDKGFDVKGFKINNKYELEAKLEYIFSLKVEVIVQSIIPGPVTNLFEVCTYMDKRSNPLCVFIKRKLRQYPGNMGLGSLMESIRDDGLANVALKLFASIAYHGIGEIEFKKDPRDNQFKMIEINSRLSLQNDLAAYCGINLPLIQYRDLNGDIVKFKGDYLEHEKWLWAEADFEAYKYLYMNKEITFFTWLKSLTETKSFALFAADDLKPFLKKVRYGLNLFKLPIFFIKDMIGK